MAKNKELTVKESAPVAELDLDQSFFDSLPDVAPEDFKLPAIQIVQPTSNLPGNPGDLIDSNSKMALTTKNEPLALVPLWFFKSYQAFLHTPDGKRKWLRTENESPSNAHYRTEREVSLGDGSKEVRQEVTNIFCLLEKDLDSDMPSIYIFRFKGKSAPEGKKILSWWQQCKGARVIPFSFVFTATPELIADEKGKYVVVKVANKVENGARMQISGEKLRVAHDAVKMIISQQSVMTAKAVAQTDDEETIDVTAKPKNYAPGALNV